MFHGIKRKIAVMLLGSLCVHNIAAAGTSVEAAVRTQTPARTESGMSPQNKSDAEESMAAETDPPSEETPEAKGELIPPLPISEETVCTINGTEATDAQISLTYNGKKINTKNTPVICCQGEYMVAYEPVFVERGPKVSYEYDKTARHAKLIRENHMVTFYIRDHFLHASSKKVSLKTKILKASCIL